MLDHQLFGTFRSVSGEVNLRSRLRLNVEIENRSQLVLDVVGFSATLAVVFSKAGMVDQPENGRYVSQSYPERWSPTLSPGHRSPWSLYVDLEQKLLQQIEEHRRGRDVQLRLAMSIIAIERGATDMLAKRVLSGCVRDSVEQYRESVGLEIARSKWLEILRNLGYGTFYVSELPLPPLPRLKSLQPAIAEMERAWKHLANGDYREVLAACFASFERLTADQGHQRPNRDAITNMLSGVLDREKVDRFLQLFEACKKYLHLGRHEQQPVVSLDRTDAELAILVTHACLLLLSRSASSGTKTNSQSTQSKRAAASTSIIRSP